MSGVLLACVIAEHTGETCCLSLHHINYLNVQYQVAQRHPAGPPFHSIISEDIGGQLERFCHKCCFSGYFGLSAAAAS